MWGGDDFLFVVYLEVVREMGFDSCFFFSLSFSSFHLFLNLEKCLFTQVPFFFKMYRQ